MYFIKYKIGDVVLGCMKDFSGMRVPYRFRKTDFAT